MKEGNFSGDAIEEAADALLRVDTQKAIDELRAQHAAESAALWGKINALQSDVFFAKNLQQKSVERDIRREVIAHMVVRAHSDSALLKTSELIVRYIMDGTVPAAPQKD